MTQQSYKPRNRFAIVAYLVVSSLLFPALRLANFGWITFIFGLPVAGAFVALNVVLAVYILKNDKKRVFPSLLLALSHICWLVVVLITPDVSDHGPSYAVLGMFKDPPVWFFEISKLALVVALASHLFSVTKFVLARNRRS